jgi:DNA modification methylase
MSDSPLTIVRVPISQLHADPANANTHDERNLRTIRDSLREFGQVEPLVVQKGTGRVIGGNGRLEVMRDEGVHEVDIVEFEGSEVQARALAIALNRTAKTSVFDDTILAEQLRALQSEDFPVAGTGFTDEEVDELLQSLGDEALGNGEVAQDEPPPLDKAAELQEKWGVKAGDLWLIPSKATPGRSHRLLCGDCTEAEDVARLMDGEKADIAVTSPPYNQHIDTFKPSGMHKEGDWVAKVERLAYPDSLPEPEYQAAQRAALGVWYAAIKDHASLFYNHKNRYRDKQVVSPLSWLPGPFRFRQEIVWSRPGSVTQNARMFLPCDERIYWLYKGDDFFFDDTTENKTFSTVWEIALEANKEHAVAFPIELPSRCILCCSQLGDMVLEPYAGSGTTIVASEQTGRLCNGMELSPGCIAVTLERLSNLGLDPQSEA